MQYLTNYRMQLAANYLPSGMDSVASTADWGFRPFGGLTDASRIRASCACRGSGDDAGLRWRRANDGRRAAECAADSAKFLTQPLVEEIYTADPSAHAFGTRLYLYASHDIDAGVPQDDLGSHFAMRDYRVLSMETVGGPVTVHGVALDIKGVPWAGRQMWAPDAAEKDGKYFLYFPAKDKQDVFRIGVAVRTHPQARSRRSRTRSKAPAASTPPCSSTATASLTCTSAASGADSCSDGRLGATSQRTRIPGMISRRSRPRSLA